MTVSESAHCVDVRRSNTSSCARLLDSLGECVLGACNCAELHRVVGHSAAGNLGVLFSAALLRGGSLLQNEGNGALSQNESGLIQGIRLALSQQTELSVKLCVNVGVFVSTACDHDVLSAVVQYVRSVADTLESCLNAVGYSYVIALDSCENAEISASRIVYGVREGECTAVCGAALYYSLLESHDLGHRAVGSTDNYADLVLVALVDCDLAVSQRAHAAYQLNLAESVELAVERHLDTVLLVVVGGDGGADSLALFLCIADYLADTGDVDLLVICVVGHIMLLLREHDGSIVAAERKGVGNREIHRLLVLGVRYEVDIPCLLLKHRQILIGITDGRRNCVLADCLYGQDCLNGASRAQAVSGHGLCGAYGKVLVLVEQCVQGKELRLVVLGSARAVRVDVVNVGELQTGSLDSTADSAHLTLSVGTGSGDVMRVGAYAGAEYLTVDLRAACNSMLVALNDEDTSALAEGDAVAVVERGAGILGQRVERVESCESQRREAVGTTGNKRVSLAGTDKVAGVGKAHGTSRARINDIRGGSVESEVLCNVVRDSSRRHSEDIGSLCGAGLELVGVVLVDARSTADAVTDDNANTVGILCGHGISGVCESLAGCLDAQQRAAVVVLAGKLLGAFSDLSALVSIAALGAECLYVMNTGDAVCCGAPALVGAIAQGADESQTGDNASVLVIH